MGFSLTRYFSGSGEIIVFHNVLGGVCRSPPMRQRPLRYPSKTGSSWISGNDVRSGISPEPFFSFNFCITRQNCDDFFIDYVKS